MAEAKLPWLKEYNVFGIPETFKPYPDKPAYDMLYKAAEKYKKQGLIQMNYKITYPEVKDHVDRLATALYKMGLKKGERVATLLPTSVQYVIADYAISRAGLVHIPSSSLEPAEQLNHKFKEASPTGLICLDEYLNVVEEILKKFQIKNIVVSKLADYSVNKPQSYEPLKVKEAVWWTELISKTSPNPPDVTFDVEKDLEMILFTGGTTGLPKGCMLTHRNVYANTIQNSNAMGAAQPMLEGVLTVLMGTPMFHSYGHCTMHSMTYAGYNQIMVPDARNTSDILDMILKYRPLIQLGVPTQFLKLTQEKLKGISILGISGSAPLPKTVQEEFEKKGGGGGIMEGYGLSEMSPVTHLNTSFMLRILGGRTVVKMNNKLLKLPGVIPITNAFLRAVGSKTVCYVLGKAIGMLSKLTVSSAKKAKTKVEKRGTIGIPLPDTEIKIVDVDTGKNLSWDEMIAGKTGEMCLRGPQRMLGYWPTPGSGLDEEGYVRTGDVVKVDENGYFYIVDRTKDMIIVSGFKVYSREIDDILHNCPGVSRAATVGIPDPERQGSERVCVFVEAQSGVTVTEETIVTYLKTTVAKYAVPKIVRIVDAIPLTEVQKIDKKKLRVMAEEVAKSKP
ncbi:MAG: acyl--CoA ligase [Syntrophaceae bacterium]|nr:acyl--CoA ligase [Syntrophaceae bacterium]